MARIFHEAYMQRNQLGYEGDSFIGKEIKKLVETYKINYIVETGTYFGYTTLKLAELSKVTTIEFLHSHYLESQQTFAENETKHQIDLIQGDSASVLNEICPKIKSNSLLFFLDAHWEKNCPLLDELRIIAENGIKPVICIHDFKVPNRQDLGYDSYNGQDFEFEWIEKYLNDIYGAKQYEYHYNNESEGAMRGVIYIYPKIKK